MTAKQFRHALKQIGLSQRKAGPFLEIDPRTVRRYALGELPIPPLIAKVLDYMVKHHLTAEDFT
jgi:hypothetical protein